MIHVQVQKIQMVTVKLLLGSVMDTVMMVHMDLSLLVMNMIVMVVIVVAHILQMVMVATKVVLIQEKELLLLRVQRSTPR